MSIAARPPIERFHENWVENENGCKIWSGLLNEYGYGRFWDGTRTVRAHRWIFEEKFGYSPPVVMHMCDTPACVNWESCLAAGTKADNSADMVSKGRQQQGSKHKLAKLTEDDTADIREAYSSGILTQKMLGEVYGLDQSSISNIIRASSWKGTKV